jgi:hypothetical protein
MKYESGGAFRRALEKRLRDLSLQSGVALNRLRKMVAFDRFLARLIQGQPDRWVLKGGLALQLRLGERARTTKDLDVLAFTQAQDVTKDLREVGRLDLGDWFSFEIADPTSRPATGFGGIRHSIQALLDSRTFEKFHIDVGVGDPLVEAVEYLSTPALLDFAGLPPTRVPCYPITQQIAEKLHANTRPHKTGESSRVKDFVDILLLAELGKIAGERTRSAIQATFSAMGTHPIPTIIPPPPENWEREFQHTAKSLGLENLTLTRAYEFIQAFLDPILMQESVGEWDPKKRTWRR